MRLAKVPILVSLCLAAWADGQVNVTADEMKAYDGKKEIHFIGDANATQERSWIHGDEIIVYLDQNNQAKRFVCKGNVTFFIDYKTNLYDGNADMVTYDPRTFIYTFTGDALVHDINHTRRLEGDYIQLDARNDTAYVKSVPTQGKKKRPVKVSFEISDTAKAKQ